MKDHDYSENDQLSCNGCRMTSTQKRKKEKDKRLCKTINYGAPPFCDSCLYVTSE